MMDLQSCISKFVDDPSSLTDAEAEALVSELRSNPEVVELLRAQLITEEFLSQRFAKSRGDLEAQVHQRVNDFLRGEDELNRQAEEIRQVALGLLGEQRSTKASSGTKWLSLAIAVSLFLATAWSFRFLPWNARNLPDAAQSSPTMQHIQGQVIVRHERQSDRYLGANETLSVGDVVLAPDNAIAQWKYDDDTLVWLAPGSEAAVTHAGANAKSLRLTHGSLSADVSPQPSGAPFQIETPHANVVVRGTVLHVDVNRQRTQVEVDEGSVDVVQRGEPTVRAVPGRSVTSQGKGGLQSLVTSAPNGTVFSYTGRHRPLQIINANGTRLRQFFIANATPDQKGLGISGSEGWILPESDQWWNLCRLEKAITVEMTFRLEEQEGDSPEIEDGEAMIPRTILSANRGNDCWLAVRQTGETFDLAIHGQEAIRIGTPLSYGDRVTLHVSLHDNRIVTEIQQQRSETTADLDWSWQDISWRLGGTASNGTSWQGDIEYLRIHRSPVPR